MDRAGNLQRPWQEWFNQVYVSMIRAELMEIIYRENSNSRLLDEAFFIANRSYQVVAVRESHSALGTDAGDVTVQIRKDTGTQAPTAGVALLSTALSLKTAVNSVQTGSLTTTEADLKLVAGDRLSVDFSGILTGVAGVIVTVTLRAI